MWTWPTLLGLLTTEQRVPAHVENYSFYCYYHQPQHPAAIGVVRRVALWTFFSTTVIPFSFWVLMVRWFK
jgi:hypothetical protein